MEEMRARTLDWRLERRARDARDAPPPPPDARGKAPSAGPSSNHDAVSVSDADAADALPSRAPRGFGVGTTTRAGSGFEDASAPSLPRGDLARYPPSLGRQDPRSRGSSGAERSGPFAPSDDDDEPATDARETRSEALRAPRAEREREETARVERVERARLLELEREVARLRAGTASLERALAEERRSRKLEAELRDELERVAARLAEACAAADETDKAARREMEEALRAARRDARRAAEAETDALRHAARAEDAEATSATLRERLRRAERRLEVSVADGSVAAGGVFGERRRETLSDARKASETDPSKNTAGDGGGAATDADALRAECVALRDDLARETSLAKSALREADDANRERRDATAALAARERELEAAAARDAEAREARARETEALRVELSRARGAFASLREQLADALADLDAVSQEKRGLAEEAALKARDAREAREEAERAARALAEERESFRRRWAEARERAEERENAHRLEKATWEDSARRARRKRYDAASEAGLVGMGEGLGVGRDGPADAGVPSRDAARAKAPRESPAASPARDAPGRDANAGARGDYVVDSATCEARAVRVSASSSPSHRGGRRDARPAFAPDGFPLPEPEAPVSSARARAAPDAPDVPVPAPSAYDRYLDSLPPSPIAGPPPPPPPGRARGPGEAAGEGSARRRRERPVR